MQSTQLNTSSSSSGASTSSGDWRSSSPANPENPNLSPPTTRIPLSPPRFVGPLQYVDPAYMKRLDSILRSFCTGTDHAEVYTALKTRLGISRSKDPASPPPAEGTPTQNTPSPPSGGNLTSLPQGLPQPIEVIDDDVEMEDSLPLPSNLLLRRREVEWNLFSTMEDDTVPGRTRRRMMDQLLEEAEVDEKRQATQGAGAAIDASEAVKDSRVRAEGESKRKGEESVLPPHKRSRPTSQGIEFTDVAQHAPPREGDEGKDTKKRELR